MLRHFGEKLIIFQHMNELVEELDSARKIKPNSYFDLVIRRDIIKSATFDIARHCRVLRKYYDCEGKQVEA